MKKWVAFIGCFFTLVLLCAQQSKYSNECLSLGIGARGLSMSNTMTAIANDVTAGYWNPACLSVMDKRYELALMHAEYFAGIAKYDYGAIAVRIDSQSTVGLSYIRFGVDNIMNTTELIDNQGNVNYNRISYFSSADHAVFLSYAHHFKQIRCLSVGGNVKILRRVIGKFAGSWGFGLDLGVHFEIKGWHIAGVLHDATSTFNAWSYHLSDQVKQVFIETGNEIVGRHETALVGNFLQVAMTVYLDNIYYRNGEFFRAKENFNVVLSRRADVHTPVEFTAYSVNCPKCAGTYDSILSRQCPYCGNNFVMATHDWMIVQMTRQRA